MRKIFTFGLLALALVAGCTSMRDARGPSEICEVHHSYMRSVDVPGPKGNPLLPAEYVATGLRTFPHAWPEYPPDNRHRLVIYICDDCARAQKAWKIQHPGAVP